MSATAEEREESEMADPISNVFVALPIHSYRGAKEGVRYECRNDKTGWRCGKCLRGLVAEQIGSRCKVCGAVVVKLSAAIVGLRPIERRPL